MLVAIDEAEKAGLRDEDPVGAAIYDHEHGHIVAKAGNNVRSLNDPTAHAEILVIREACKKIGQSRLAFFSLYVTLEPCIMCMGALFWSKLDRIVYAASDPKNGFRKNNISPHPKTKISYGIREDESSNLLKAFFRAQRE